MFSRLCKYSIFARIRFITLFVCLFWHSYGVSNNKQPIKRVPIKHYITAPAIADSSKDIVSVLPVLNGAYIMKIFVKPGDIVTKGDPLFELDDDLVKLQVRRRRKNIDYAQIRILEEQKKLEKANRELSVIQSIDVRAVSKREIKAAKDEVALEKMKLREAQIQLDMSLEDLEYAKATVEHATVHALKDGIVLGVGGVVGNLAIMDKTSPIVMLGDKDKVLVRVAIDERDVDQYDAKSPVYITSIDNSHAKIPLTFLRIEPYIKSKYPSVYFGDRTQTRILETVYYFKRADYPNIYPGQQFDAHILVTNRK